MQRETSSNGISTNTLKTPMSYGCRSEFNPQQEEFVFDELTLDSKFDSGNMASATKESNGHYNIWISPDCCGTNTETHHKTWFYFRVKNVSRNSSYTYTFTIKNISTQIKLFNEGLMPVYRSFPSSLEWKKIRPQPLSIQATDKGLEVSFNHMFNLSDDETYFAFTYPWSYSEDQEVLNKYEQELRDDPEIYFNRELLTYSLEQRRIDLLTITSHTNKLDQKERIIPDLFPEKSPHDRPLKFSNKKYVLISARVHPGETPASYAFHSLLRFLLSKTDPRAKVLRDNFVMVLIPMLNPDGVYRGHWRVDTQGLNLNRFYTSPTSTEHPSIYAVKEIMVDLNNTGRLFLYCDLHAHAGKKGVFVYGNSLPFKQQVEARMFAKILSLNSEYFEYDTCSFSDQNTKLRDKSDGEDKEGAGRVALFKATNLACCYTLEFNYNSGKYRNVLTEPVENKVIQVAKGKEKEVRKGREEEKEVVPTFSSVSTASPEKLGYSECYTSNVFEEVGEAIGPTLLDMLEINPLTRLKSSPYKNLKTLRLHIATNLPKDSVVRVSAYLNKATKNIEVGAKPKVIHANSTKLDDAEPKRLRNSKSKPKSTTSKISSIKEIKRPKK